MLGIERTFSGMKGYRVRKKTDVFHIEISRELIAGISG